MSRHRRILVGTAVLLASALVPVLGSPSGYAAKLTRSRWPVGTTVVSGSPLGPRRSPALAVRGSKVFVVGGEKLRDGQPVKRMNDGAELDLRTRKWQRLPDAPFRRTETTSALAVGRRVLVAGVTCPGRVGGEHACSGGHPVAAVYSVGTHAWRPLRIPARFVRGSLTALRSLMATRDEAWFTVDDSTVSVNVRTGQWRDIPPPLTGSTCAAGSYAAVFGSNDPSAITALRLLGVHDREWGVPALPAGFASSAVGGSPSCNADSVVVVKGDLRAQACTPQQQCTSPQLLGSPLASVQRYDLAARQWSTIEPPPPEAQAGASPLGHGPFIDFFGVNGKPGIRLTTASGTWTPIAPGPKLGDPANVLLWARGVVVTSDDSNLVVYRPV